MGEINFISTNNKKNKNQSKNGKGLPQVEWTKPKDHELISDTIENNNQPSIKEEKNKGLADKNYLRKSRQEVLAMIKKEKSQTNKEGDSFNKKEKSGKSGIFGWLSRLRKNNGRDQAAGSKGLKKDKEILSDYKKEIDNEKSKRKAGNELISSDSAAPENKKVKAGGLENIIKEKLSFKRDKWRARKVFTTNLVKDEITTFFDWKKSFKALLRSVLYIGLIITAVYVGLIFWEIRAAQQREFVVSKIEDIKQEIIKIEGDIKIIDVFQKKLELANSLLNKHIYWTNFFKFLEENILTNVYYTGGFSGDTNGKYSFPAQTDSFSAIADQIKVMRLNEKVLTVNADSGRLVVDKSKDIESEAKSDIISFQLQLSINKDVFFK